MVIIGVDPAFRKGGFWACFLDMSDRSCVFRPFRDVLTWDRFLRSPEAPQSAYVVVENSNLQNATFYTHKTAKGALLTASQAKRSRALIIPLSHAELTRASRNVGTNQGVSELTVRSAIDRYGKDAVLNLSPEKKGAKYDERYFLAALKGDRVTPVGYTGTQDERDAYKLAHIGISELRVRRRALI